MESLYRFVMQCRTWDDEAKSVAAIPALPHIGLLVGQWWYTRSIGQPLIIEKSRRLVVSWVCSACELWSMGLQRETRGVAGLNYPKAAEHVWRAAWLYRNLPKEYRRLDCTCRGGNYEAMEVRSVILPNGSKLSGLNQQSGTFQGSGYTGVRMEELSLFARPAAAYSQAQIVTGGRADRKRGHVVAVTNAHPNQEWRELKNLQSVIYNADPTWNPNL